MPPGTLSVDDVDTSSDLSVSCNGGILTINNADTSEVTGVSVLSISGATVYSSSSAVSTIDLSAEASGIYILVVEEGASRITKKFVKN